MGYPKLKIDLQKVEENARLLSDLCREAGVALAGVLKGCSSDPEITRAVAAGGVAQLASSRLSQIKRLRQTCPETPTMLIRIPMGSEAEEVVRWCDYSLNSEIATLQALNAAAIAQKLRHNVVLMYDVGDLREGKPTRQEVLSQALLVEKTMPGLNLTGVGCNLNCFSAIRPSQENLTDLAELAGEIEAAVGRKLDIVSGGSTTSIPLLLKEGLPAGINHLRAGEGILLAQDFGPVWQCVIPGLHTDTMVLEVEVVEAGVKPTRPKGVQSKNGFGVTPGFTDRGDRARAIGAVGAYDVGDVTQLLPMDPRLEVLGGSSDHVIVDTQACPGDYSVGSVMGFRLFYQAMVFAFLSPDIEKEYSRG